MRHFSILFVSAVLFSSALGQIPETGSEICTVENSRFLVGQLAAESRSVREADKRVNILVRLADFSWPFDEPTAREYFTEAYGVAGAHFKEKGFETARPDRAMALTMPKPDLRMTVIKAVARHDAKWAERLSEEVLKEFEKAAAERSGLNREREIQEMIGLAGERVEEDPAFSLMIFRRLMRYPLEQHWFWALYQTASKNPQLAATLYTELLQAYRNQPARRLLILSAYPFGRERMFGVDRFTIMTTMPTNSTADPMLQRRFLETFFARIATAASNPEERLRQPEPNRQPDAVYMYSALLELEPIVISEHPGLIQRFTLAKSQANSLLTDEMRSGMDQRESSNSRMNTSFDELLEQAEEADKEGKLTDNMIITMVIRQRKTEEQFARLEPWLDKIKEDQARKDSTNYFWFTRSKLAITETRFADATRFSAKVAGAEDRAVLAFDLAEKQMENLSEAAGAYQTLSEVAKIAQSLPDSATKAKILMGLAYQYERFNPGFAMQELSDSVAVINRLQDPDLGSTGVMRQIIGKQYSFFTVYTVPGYDLERTYSKLAARDLGLSLSNARALEDKYLRTIAVLAVTRECAKKPRQDAADPAVN